MDKDLKIRIKIDSETAKLDTLNNKVNNTAKGLNDAASMASAFENKILALGGAYLTLEAAINSGKMFIAQADSMKLLDARLKLTTSSLEEYENQQRKLLNISKQTYTIINDTTTLYTKLNPALTKLGADTGQVNIVMTSFVKGLQLGGANAAETSSSVLQFAQAMGSGVLRGDEFNSMAEASPKLLEYMAKGLGVAQTELRKMAEEGKLTALEVANALIKVKTDIDRDFLTLPITVSKATTNAMTELAIGIKDIDDAIGITDTLAKSIERTTLNIGYYTQSVIGYYQEVKNFLDDNKMLTETISKTFDFLGRAGNTTLTIATLDTINNSFKSTKLGADEIIKKIDELEQRKVSLAQNKWTDQNTKAINIQISDLKNQLAQLNNGMLITANDVIPQNKTAVDELIGSYDGYVEIVKTINKTPIRNENEVNKLLGNEKEKLLQQLDDNIKKARSLGATEKEINDYRIRELNKFNEKQNKANKESIKSAEDLNKALLDIKQIGMSEYDKGLISITEKTKEWIKIGLSENDVLIGKNKLLSELNQKTQAALVKEDLSYYERLVQLKSDSLKKDIELASISYTQKTLDIQDMNRPAAEKEKLISLESELYSKTLERLSLDDQSKQLNETSEAYQKMLDSQISLIDATNDWNSNLTGTAASLADIASATGNLSKLNLVNLKAEDKLRTEYEDKKLKAHGNITELQKLDLKYAKDKAALDDKNISATLIGYSNIAGAISGMFEQGSKEAATFQIAQSTLALVEGTRAILTAGTGDPYTAIPRMIAMAAMVSSLLSNIGVAFGMNSTSTYSDSFSSMEANTGTGTVFGDISAQSESITNSLDILEDFAQPQYQTLLSMNNYLETIANNIGGVTSLLIQQGGFAFGDGYVGFDTGWKNNLGLNNDIATAIFGGGAGLLLSKLKIPIVSDIAGLFGSVVNSVLGGVFGKTKTYQSLKDSGIYFANQLLTRAINDFNGSAYQTIETTVTSKSWFSKSETTYLNTYFKALDNETERQFSLVLGNLYNTVLTAGVALDSTEAQTANKLKNFVVSIGKISLKGKTGDQIQETLEAVFGSIGDKIALKAFPALVPFQQIGEGMFETLTRVATGMEEAEFYISRLGNRFDDVIYTAIGNKQGDVGFEALLLSIENVEKATYPLNNNLLDIVENLDITAEELYTVYTSLDELRDRLIFLGVDAQGLSSTMIYGAGTITDLQSGFKAYFENFLSDDEQLAYKTEQLTEKFNDLGLALPSSNLAFKDLLLSIDETTASGQELFGRLIVLSEEFAQVSSLRVDALQEELDITNGTISNIKEISTSLDNVITSLRSGLDNSSTNMLEKFNKSMNATLLLSATDDYTALAKSVKDTINYSSALNNSDYFGSLKEMQYAQSVAANQFESININLDDELSVLQTIASNTNEMIKALSNLTTAVKQLQDSSETTASNTAESRYVS